MKEKKKIKKKAKNEIYGDEIQELLSIFYKFFVRDNSHQQEANIFSEVFYMKNIYFDEDHDQSLMKPINDQSNISLAQDFGLHQDNRQLSVAVDNGRFAINQTMNITVQSEVGSPEKRMDEMVLISTRKERSLRMGSKSKPAIEIDWDDLIEKKISNAN